MDLTLKRIARREKYTIGRLYVEGKYFCDTIEDKDRGLSQALPVTVNKNLKRRGVTAIPVGRYRVTLAVQSPKYKDRQQYAFCKGYVPRLLNVPAYEGVLIHIGNTSKDTEGCILVGENKVVGKVINSTNTFYRLYERLRNATDLIYITIE